MNKTHLLGLFLALSVVLTSLAPAPIAAGSLTYSQGPAAATPATYITLTITNNMPKPTTLTLSGTAGYTIYLANGASTTRKIAPGRYKYDFAGCLGKVKKGNLKVKANVATLTIGACKVATILLINFDKSRSASVSLKGWMSYNESIGPRQSKIVSWVADNYAAKVRFCGFTFNMDLKVRGRKIMPFPPCD
jgi:hypothetical protein